MIFDYDGTLVDSEPAHALATRAGLAEAGIDLSIEEFMARWVGLPDVECYRGVAEDRGVILDPAVFERVRGAKNRFYEATVLEGRVPLCEGAVELVRALGGRARLAVCSAARRVEIESTLARHGLLDVFGTIVAVEDVARSKPDPQGYRLAARRLELEPDACVAIEDTPRGVHAARGAGMRVVAVAQTLPSSRLVGEGPSLVVDRLADLTPEALLALAAEPRA